MTTGFRFDLGLCTGCQACRLACTVENDLEWGTSWRRIDTHNPARHPDAPLVHLSLACHHCERPACLPACPARAIGRDERTGAVLIDGDRCIGCGYCGWACPFDAPLHDPRTGVMTKCTLCSHRLAEGRAPACVTLCPTGALQSGELAELDGVECVAGFAATDLAPAIRFVPLRVDRLGPELRDDPAAQERPVAAPRARVHSPIALETEWPLVGFTLVAAGLVAWWSAAQLAAIPLAPWLFAPAALAGAALSSLHLGRKERAWRALLGLGSSWLSREVLGYTLFAALALAYLFFGAVPAWSVTLVGFGTLFCVDRVYDVVRRAPRLLLHSADALPTGLFLTGIIAGAPWIAAPLGLLKLILYLMRRGSAWWPFALVRVGVGLLLPALLWWLRSEHWQAWALAAAVAGELVDRCAFYLELGKRDRIAGAHADPRSHRRRHAAR